MPTKSAARTIARDMLVRAFTLQIAAQNRRHKKQPNKQIERILVLRPDHLGDLLFATPTLHLLRSAFPSAHITGAVGPWGRAMWAGNPNIDELQVIAFPGITEGRGGLEPYKLLASSAGRLSMGNYDMGIVLRYDHWWGAALLWAAGIPRRWGYSTPGMAAWLTGSVPYTRGRHEVEQDLQLVKPLLAKHVSLPFPAIDRNAGMPPLTPPSPEQVQSDILDAWLRADVSQRVIVHPGTAAANKLWTIKGWGDVIDSLTAAGMQIVLTGSPAEAGLCTAIVEASATRPSNLAGQTANIAQLAYVMSETGIVLGVDSGPLHIACALGKKTLHLYGPSDEAIWGPWGDPRLHRPFRAPGTRPTQHLDVGSTELEGGPEMRAITPAQVLAEVEALRLA